MIKIEIYWQCDLKEGWFIVLWVFHTAEFKDSPTASRCCLVKQANLGISEHLCQEKLEIWRDGDESLWGGSER